MRIHTNEDGTVVYTFRQSWIKTFMQCPELARREAFDPEHLSSGSDATAIGTAMHAGAEHERTTGAPYAECLERAVAEFDYEASLPGFRYVQVAQRDTALTQVDVTLSTWHEKVRPKLGDPLAIEEHFNVLLHQGEGYEVRLSGTIDYVCSLGIMWDWKTANDKDKYGRRKAWEYQRWAIQPTVYTYAWQHLYEEPVPFTFAVCLKGKHGQDPQFLSVTRDEQHWQWLTVQLESIIHMWKTMGETGPWPLNDQHVLCSPKWCPAWDTCKGLLVPKM